MNDVTKAVDVVISGRVQGVGYRYTCQVEAEKLGVRGWVRNDFEGTVTGRFEGPTKGVDKLVAWCRHGPAGARVSDVQVSDAAPEGHTRFSVR